MIQFRLNLLLIKTRKITFKEGNLNLMIFPKKTIRDVRKFKIALKTYINPNDYTERMSLTEFDVGLNFLNLKCQNSKVLTP